MASYVPATVQRTDEGNVAILTMSRPGRRNAHGADLAIALLDHLRDLSEDDRIRACILTGADGTFCSGADIGHPDTHRVVSIAEAFGSRKPYGDFFEHSQYYEQILRFQKPLVSAVDGYAIGAGLLYALCSDVIVAAEGAQFALTNVKYGVLPAAGALTRLALWIGRGRAMEIGLTGRRVDAQEAYRIGLVTSLSSSEKLLDTARTAATQLASLPPLAVRFAKESMNEGLEDLVVRPSATTDKFRTKILQSSEDTLEANRAWREKRAPEFHNR